MEDEEEKKEGKRATLEVSLEAIVVANGRVCIVGGVVIVNALVVHGDDRAMNQERSRRGKVRYDDMIDVMLGLIPIEMERVLRKNNNNAFSFQVFSKYVRPLVRYS